MAVSCGRHVWPDANHRTALLAFNLALERGLGWQAVLNPAMADRMVRQSKLMRDGEYREAGGNRGYYTVAELTDSNHPYRKLFSQGTFLILLDMSG